jgi:uncharacterized membrane protein
VAAWPTSYHPSSRVDESTSSALLFYFPKGGDARMNVMVYALFTYGLTAVIALLVIAVIVGLNKLLGSKPDKKAD